MDDSDSDAHAHIISSLQLTVSQLLTLLELGPRLLSDEEFTDESKNLICSAYSLVRLSDQLLTSRIISGFSSLPLLDNVSIIESIQRTVLTLPYVVEHARSMPNEDFAEELNGMLAASHSLLLLSSQLSSLRSVEKFQADISELSSQLCGGSQPDSLPAVVREFKEMFDTDSLGANATHSEFAPKSQINSDATSPQPCHNTVEKMIQTEGITAAHGFISLHIEEIPVDVVCFF